MAHSDSWRERHLAKYPSIQKMRTASKASGGDPSALREILSDLAEFLRGKKELEPAYARFCFESLESFLSSPKIWEEAIPAFKERDLSNTSISEIVTQRGPRLPESTLRRIGSAFCRAFHLSKPPGTEEYHFLLTPAELWKIFWLRLFGASLPRAIAIVRSAKDIGLSDRQIKEWFNRASWLKIPEPGTYGFRVGQHQRRLMLASQVLHRTVRRMSFDTACEEVAELAVRKLCFLPDATLFLETTTVREAFDFATSCGDPRWHRVERLITRFAQSQHSSEKQEG